MFNRARPATLIVLLAAALVAVTQAVTNGDDSAGLRTRSGRRPIFLWPPEKSTEQKTELGVPITLGNWTYRAFRAGTARDGVPWELIVTPAGSGESEWKKGQALAPLPGLSAERSGADKPLKDENAIPVIEMPDILWKKWMSRELHDVVGIHFHELVTDDHARILFTLHKVPPDLPDGTAPESEIYGTRIEATLLAPVQFNLDQTVVARADPLDKNRVVSRGEHELGHAQLSQSVIVAVISGPQDWDPTRCIGRRSRIEYYWKREQIGRSWSGYRDRTRKILALRTSIVLVPPTRWSMMLPIPPERVTQKHIQSFNDSIVSVARQFAEADRLAQERFHAEHGAFEAAP
ncbi:MAG: hypothetical protein HS101_04910 [Planctomycetia bacterium]|jgi:hypothetical protein|nr:hypothetical protein [Planctomycetia bacterium]MCC7314294.1 hypothetical protein [Planctomycetota bacterium]OQZ05593.1 MAG: hypothetical protein B6D36_09355 [Planctomycetes bacterium UTPLA1]